MTNAAHTPGPWAVDNNDKNLITADIDGGIIAEVWGLDSEERNEVTIEANARLIAAAPELLTVAEFALEHLDGQEYLQACAIIAKAKGGAA